MSSDLILPCASLQDLDKPPFVIMLVDDRPFIAEAIQRLVSDEADISLHYCPDPYNALEMAERVDPTVILLDVLMPEMDGFTLCRFLRAHPRTREMPVIMLSGSTESTIKAQAFAAGANDYLIKLPDKMELLAKVRYHSYAYLSKKERDKASAALRVNETKMGELYLEMSKISNRDILTGLVNRNGFEQRCEELWSLATRNNIPISLLMMDFDRLSAFNEHFGHPKGDESIKAASQVFRQRIRRLSDIVARFSDERFIALLPATQPEGAAHVAELVRTGVESLQIPHPKSEVACHLTISLGVAGGTPERGANVEMLLKLAENCLNKSKESGRNQFHLAHLTGE